MDKSRKDALENELDDAERHVERGERLIERQRNSIEERRRDGHDVELASDLLGEMEESQRHHIEHRDLIRGELAEQGRTNAEGKK